MKRTLSIFLICACRLSAMGQSPMESILSSVEDNNTTLKALRLEMEAEKLSNDGSHSPVTNFTCGGDHPI